MDYEKDEQVIYFKDLVFVALYQWRRVLVFAIVFALLLGGFTGISGWMKYNASVGVLTEAQEEYQQQLKQYEAQKQSLESEIENTVQRLEDIQKAAEASPLQGDSAYTAYALYAATVKQSVNSNTTIVRDEAHTVMQSYNALLSGQTAANSLAETLGFDVRYISEVFSTSYNNDARTLKVSVTYTTAEAAKKGLEALQTLLASSHKDISEATVSHSLNLVVEDLQNVTYENLQQHRAEQKKASQELNSRLSEMEEMLDKLTVPAAPRPMSKADILTDTAIYAVIGAVLGAFLAAAWGWLGHLAGGKVYSKRTLQDRTHIETIAVMDDLKGNALDRWLCRQEGRTVGEESRQICCSIVQQYCANAQKVQLLYCGTDPQTDLENALGVKALPAQANTLQAVEQFAQCDCVVLVAQCHVSRYDLLKQQSKQISALGKKLVGCVLING